MKHLLQLVTVLLIGISTASRAQTNEAAAMGQGSGPCAKFEDFYRADPFTAENLYFAWAQGFMTGLNYAEIGATGNSQNLSSIDISEQQEILRQFCDRHPQANYIGGVLELYKKFPPNQRLK